MLTKEKIKSTQKLLSKGVPEGELKNQLREEGYNEEDILNIFKPEPYDMRSWLLFFGILICIAGIYIFMQQGSPLLLILGCLLLLQYYRELLRLGIKKKDENTME